MKNMNIECDNPNLYNALSMEIGVGYNQVAGGKVVDAVHNSLTGALGICDDEIIPSARLTENLSVESIDNMDIALRLEKLLNIKIHEKVNLQNTVIGLTKRVYDIVTNQNN